MIDNNEWSGAARGGRDSCQEEMWWWEKGGSWNRSNPRSRSNPPSCILLQIPSIQEEICLLVFLLLSNAIKTNLYHKLTS